jgi:hypothetical protein
MERVFPSAVRLLYFHVDNADDVKSSWNFLAKKLKLQSSEDKILKSLSEGSKTHRMTKVYSLEGKESKLSMSLYQNIVIVSGLFYYKDSLLEQKAKLGFEDMSGKEALVGEATLLISEEKQPDGIFKAIHREYTKLDTSAGVLFQFEEMEGEKEHLYLLSQPRALEAIDHFLTLHFPVFDFSVHKLHMERDYFKNQRIWIIKEKAEIDKTVGDILHKRIIGETLNSKYIEALEKEVDTLSTKYGILVNDGHLIRKARTTLEDDMENVYRALGEFGKIPEGDLDIINNSMELQKKLIEDEKSISYAIKNVNTAIDTVRTNVDLLRSRENIYLQKEAVSFQVAAGVLEFIIVFYYSIASWEHIIGTERIEFIPPQIRFITIFTFALLSVALTHFVGESFREKWKINKGMILSGAALILVFIYIVYISLQTGILHVADVPH